MISQPRLGLTPALEVKRWQQGRASCQQVEEAILLGLRVSWELSCTPCLLLVGSREQEDNRAVSKKHLILQFLLCLQTAEQGLECLHISVGHKAKAGKP